MLEIKDLVKRYGKFTAVDHLSLSVPEGTIYGFVGPNGAGKTTTMRIMAGLLTATEGSVLMDGIDATKNPKALRERISYIPHLLRVYYNLKLTENNDYYDVTYAIP